MSDLKVPGSSSLTKVAIGCALRMISLPHDIRVTPFFRSFLTSFCRTLSRGFEYHIYITYDYNDPVLSTKLGYRQFLEAAQRTLIDYCIITVGMSIDLKLIRLNYTGKPASAQNDAMMAAYHDNMTYFYRINDDTTLVTPDWTNVFISRLLGMSSIGVGVVGPNHIGDRTSILTYDFVHRTHIDIHGYYYPPELTDWYADGWITCE